MAIIIFIIVLSVLVLVHEAGHFFVAKYFDIRVDEFGLGYPPKAKKLFRWKGTDFTLNWLPFGGFVRIFGENPTDEPIQGDSLDKTGDNFQSKNRGIQSAVLVAGVISNLIFAWFLLTIVLMIGINGDVGSLVRYNIFGALWHGFLTTSKVGWLLIQALGQFIWGAIHGHASLADVVGPVGLVGFVGQASAEGISYLLYFVALISINLAIVNMLPFPALDGGRLLFVIIESIRRKPINPKVFNILNTTGFALLVILMVVVTFRDIAHLV
jgi:regulator of sigma E protease